MSNRHDQNCVTLYNFKVNNVREFADQKEAKSVIALGPTNWICQDRDNPGIDSFDESIGERLGAAAIPSHRMQVFFGGQS